MTYEILPLGSFERKATRLIKKYSSLKNELFELVEKLKINPEEGTPIGNNCFKIRLPIASKGKGKSGGARIITNVVVKHLTVYLISIYDKAEQESLSNKELRELLKKVPL